jgi:hypothetical protein
VKQPRNWKAIELVAGELIEREELLGTEVEVLVELADGMCPAAEAADGLQMIGYMAERGAF